MLFENVFFLHLIIHNMSKPLNLILVSWHQIYIACSCYIASWMNVDDKTCIDIFINNQQSKRIKTINYYESKYEYFSFLSLTAVLITYLLFDITLKIKTFTKRPNSVSRWLYYDRFAVVKISHPVRVKYIQSQKCENFASKPYCGRHLSRRNQDKCLKLCRHKLCWK